MKTFLTLFILLFVLTFVSYPQERSGCSHKASFEKSWISDTLDAISYTIYIEEFDFTNQEIIAHTDIGIASKINNLNYLNLELMDLTVDEVKVDNVVIPNYQHEGYILTIPLSSPINSGDIVEVSVAYHGQPFHEDWGGFHWSGNYAFNLGVGFESIPHNLGKTWFPCIDDFRDRALYTIYATVPTGMDAVCGGLLQEIVNNGNGTLTYKWTLGQTIPTYLASVAVGNYARWTSTYPGINNDIPVEIWIRPSDSNNVAGSFANLNEILAIFEEKFGPYRFDRVGYVGAAIGAMEHATNIAYPHFAINGNLQYESLCAHELSHMWFGDNVTCASAEDMWINEGWATFMDGIYQEFLYSRDQYLDFIRGKHKQVIQFCHTPGGVGSFIPLNQIPQSHTYNTLAAYDRGAIMAHTLRGYLGDDIFFETMATFLDEKQFSPVSSEDMRDFITGHTGINMTGWFDNWVFHAGTPHFSIDSFSVTQNGSEADVTVYLRQKRQGPAFIGNSNRLELTFMDNEWNRYEEQVQFDGETGSAVVNVPFTPSLVTIDMNELMCDAITDYSRTVKQTGIINFPNSFFKLDVQSVTDSAFFRIEHNWAPPDGLKTPVQGLILSPYRYWKIDGIIPVGFEAKGVFHYNKTAFLDDGLIFNSSDSLVILFRPGTESDWQFIPFTKIGSWSIGNLFVDDIQKGEYTLAVCDDTFVGIKETCKKNNTGLYIFPNPSDGKINIDTSQPGYLRFFDLSGKPVSQSFFVNSSKTFSWDALQTDEGLLIVEFRSLDSFTIATEKIVILKR